ncbi:monoheme cytochrome C [Paracrocinitomix mangrovi]|uniref:monoheme cytochrome C n=1 Tax=Paracrocinitomix mangrovi TaxID=2862509 RepID=UPI001C8D62E5|nr:monoheme cytochrome C [Paracrocinitomix mangrovi]UKN03758.1 monoheme cytochrome C [Paracrocinitomix mangrovi]
MDFEEYKELALKRAKIAINTGVLIIVFSVVWLLQVGLFPDLFDPAPEIVAMDTTNVQEEYIPSTTIDSADVVDGIHQPTGLIVDKGVEDVMVTCGACHSLNLVTQNRATREGWKDIIVWMQETQKLWDLGPKEEVILDYLGKNYAPENEGRRPNLVVEEWYHLN